MKRKGHFIIWFPPNMDATKIMEKEGDSFLKFSLHLFISKEIEKNNFSFLSLHFSLQGYIVENLIG